MGYTSGMTNPTDAPRILALAGSARKGSWNRRILDIAASGARAGGATVTVVDMADYVMPMYDGDHEEAEGLPEAALRLKELFKSHDGLMFACPEYNSSITPLLKNTIDWVSRPVEGEGPLEAFAGKTAVLMSASPGALGGMRGLVTVRSILGNIRVIVLPDQYAVGAVHTKFGDDGSMSDERDREMLEGLGRRLAEYLSS